MENFEEEINLPVYEYQYDPLTDRGLVAISLVRNPAIQSDFLHFNDAQGLIKFKAVDNEKRKIMGAIMIAGTRIKRIDEVRGKHLALFSADVIERMFDDFNKKSNINDLFNIEHNQESFIKDGIYLTERWLTGKNDKSKDYGFDFPVGSMMGTFKIEDETIWNEYIKTGKVKGFSIEAGLRKMLKFSEQAEQNSIDNIDNIKNILLDMGYENPNSDTK